MTFERPEVLDGAYAPASETQDPQIERYVRQLLEIVPVAGEHLADGKSAASYTEYLNRILHAAPNGVDKTIHPSTILHGNDAALFLPALESLRSGTDEAATKRLCCGLEFLENLGYYDPVLPWLRTLVQQPNERVRSKAVKLLCKARDQRQLDFPAGDN